MTGGGQTYCWGPPRTANLQRTVDQALPQAVSQGGVTFTSITAGASHSCGLTAAGQAYCWGSDNYGQTGNGITTGSAAFAAVVQNGATFTSISAGLYHTCGLTGAGQAYCWGNNANGQLGDGSGSNQNSAVSVSQGGVTYVGITVGGNSTCGLTSSGQAYCWGLNYQGILGNGTSTTSTTPVAVTQSGVIYSSISISADHTCSLTAAGRAYCWGVGASGQIGNSGSTGQALPVAVAQGAVAFTTISAKQNATCGLANSGVTYCWGANVNGQVGDGTTVNRITPVAVSQSPNTFTFIDQGSNAFHSCGLTAGKAYCWGNDSYGQLGIAGDALTPVATLYLVDSEGASASVGIDPSFTFSVAGRATACNGASTPTGTSTSTAVDLGHLTTASPVLGAQDFTAATNAGSGFSVSVKFSGPLTATSGATFANASGSAGSPAAFGSGEAFGYTTSANSGFAGPLWAGPTTSYVSLYTASAPTASVSNCIAYQAQAGPLTPAGNYAVTVIYLATPTF